MHVSGKVIVVTGGGNGIGREVVLQLLERGASVAAIDVNEQGLAETVGLSGSSSKLSTHVVDLSNRDAVAGVPKLVLEKHGAVDGLINVAGIIQPFVKVNDLDFDAIDRVMNVNFFGLVAITKAFLPELLTRPEAHIVNVSSMGAYAPVPGQTLYGASKAAVQLFTEGLHSELLDTNVRVTTVFPGAISTHIAVNSGIMTTEQEKAQAGASQTKPMKTTSAPVAATTLIDGMERNTYRVFIGSDAKTMDRLRRLMPQRAAKLIYDNMKSLLG